MLAPERYPPMILPVRSGQMLVDRARRLLVAIGSIGALPTDSVEDRVLKRAIVFTAIVTILASGGWMLVGLLMGSLLVMATSFAFCLVIAADVFMFALARDAERFVAVLLAAGLGIVFVGYVTLGGSVAGGSDLAWGIIAPIGAVIFYGPRRSVPWFGVFAVMVVVALAIDPLVRPLGQPPPYPFSLVLVGFNVLAPAAIVFVLLRYIDGQRSAAKAQSERLLLNILPAAISERLKAGEQHIAEQYAEASVLFADVVDFTPLVGQTPAPALIELLTALFTRFDELADQHGLEKIKTIGDAYMAAAGVPVARTDHALAAVEMGIAMQRAVADWTATGNRRLRLRVGVASGPVIAGVIGRRKFAYDLWGDTVNVASRMESTGEPGCIQVTEDTYRQIDRRYPFVRRDEVAVKGKAPMTTYVLDPARLA